MNQLNKYGKIIKYLFAKSINEVALCLKDVSTPYLHFEY